MAQWIRYSRDSSEGFGLLEGGQILVHSGDMFAGSQATGETVALGEVEVLTPCQPSKMICLWNNFHELSAKLGTSRPPDPLYFLKAPSAFIAHGQTVRRPPSFAGTVVFEGEIGIVIGKRCANISEDEAADHIFGYTCVNDVTAADILNKDASFRDRRGTLCVSNTANRPSHPSNHGCPSSPSGCQSAYSGHTLRSRADLRCD